MTCKITEDRLGHSKCHGKVGNQKDCFKLKGELSKEKEWGKEEWSGFKSIEFSPAQ